jgi:quercetin dioxygenase-like cupin family protein
MGAMMGQAVDARSLPVLPFGVFTLRPFAGDQLMLVRVEAPAGAKTPPHAHPQEPMCLVSSGRLRFRIGDAERMLGPFEAIHIPSGMEHEAGALEAVVFYDIFHPVREDYLEWVAASDECA